MIRTADIEGIRIRGAPTEKMIRAELERLGMAITEAALMLRINDRTMRRYLQEPGTAGYTPMPFPIFALLKNLKAPR